MGLGASFFQKGFSLCAKPLFNDFFNGIMNVKSLDLRGGKLYLVVVLDGIPDRDINLEIGMFAISEDCSKVTLGKYRSDMPFLANILNKYVALTFTAESPAARVALKAIRQKWGPSLPQLP